MSGLTSGTLVELPSSGSESVDFEDLESEEEIASDFFESESESESSNSAG